MSEPVREWRFYLGIDNDTVWSIIQDEVPVLLQQLAELKKASA